MYYVYVLENTNDKTWYIGMTENLVRRVKEHQSGKGGRTTRLKKGWKLIYFEGYVEKADAMGRERFLKGGSGHKYIKKQLRYYFKITSQGSSVG